jgi:hypothetical protein
MPEKPAEPAEQEPVLRDQQDDTDPIALPQPPVASDRPATDTATDWDEWMERHGGKPRPVPDVADAEGKLTE